MNGFDLVIRAPDGSVNSCLGNKTECYEHWEPVKKNSALNCPYMVRKIRKWECACLDGRKVAIVSFYLW